MSDLTDMLEGLLSDPDTTNKLRALLEPSKKEPEQSAPELLPASLDPAMIMKLTRIMQKMNSRSDNTRTRLLCDLKPYLSAPRVRRVDEAIEILKLIDVVDLLKEGGE